MLQPPEETLLTDESRPASTSPASRTFWQKLVQYPLFWRFSGASLRYLEESYPDHNKYRNLGAAIVFTGLFAFISAFFALSYLTSNWLVIVSIAALWSVTIINIDMLIVSTMVKRRKFSWQSAAGFLSRVALGTIIAISVSVPLEMTLLKDEIRDEVDRYDRAQVEAVMAQTRSAYAEAEPLKAQLETLRARFIDEMQGRPTASGRRGLGPIAKNIEEEMLQVQQRLAALEHGRDSTLRATGDTLTALQVNNNKYGFLASYRALHRLKYDSEDQSVFYISLGIQVLLLMIELLPIIAKSLMRRGAYDARYQYEDYKLVRFFDRQSDKIT